jgi:hypothetical protein
MAKVLRWTFAHYPASARFLEIDSHGGGMLGLGTDAHSPYKTQSGLMPIQGLARALRDGSGGRPIDLVFFNACRMANAEALYEIAPVVHYAVASELPISSAAENVVVFMPMFLETLARSGKPPAEIAHELARQAMAKDEDGLSTAVAIDLVSLYVGGSGRAFLSHGYAQTRFARATGWDKVLRALGR